MRIVTKSVAKRKFLSFDKKKLGIAHAIHPTKKCKISIILLGDKQVMMICDNQFWM